MPLRHPRVRFVRFARIFWLLVAYGNLSWFLVVPAFSKEKMVIQNTVEWGRLVTLWHQLIDHSSGIIYSSERYKELAPTLEKVDADLAILTTRKVLSKEMAEGLRWVFHSRYDYIKEHCYSTAATGRQDELQAAEAVSHWILEMQLDHFRQQSRAGSTDQKLLDAIQGNLTRELTFQRCLIATQGQLAQQEATASKDTKQTEIANVKLSNELYRKRQALLDAYQRHKLPRDRMVQNLVPYLLELTKAQPK